MSHVLYMFIHRCVICHTYDWPMSHMCDMTHHMCYVTSLIWVSHGSTIVWIRHNSLTWVTLRDTYEWVTSHMSLSHITQLNELRHIYEWVPSHI